jgi:calcium/proton exchanger cax
VLKRLLAGNWLNLLLVFVPVAMVLEWGVHAAPTTIFVVSCLAVIPLAGLMGHATEELAERMGEGVGGLLNATFGNAAELIIAIIALRAGLFDLVKASITGSIIGNILLVFGLSALCGGLRFTAQKFNATAASAGSTLLVLSAAKWRTRATKTTRRTPTGRSGSRSCSCWRPPPASRSWPSSWWARPPRRPRCWGGARCSWA